MIAAVTSWRLVVAAAVQELVSLCAGWPYWLLESRWKDIERTDAVQEAAGLGFLSP